MRHQNEYFIYNRWNSVYYITSVMSAPDMIDSKLDLDF